MGEKKEFLREIKNELPKNIDYEFISKKKLPYNSKKRYVDNLSLNKVLGVYKLQDDPLSKKGKII